MPIYMKVDGIKGQVTPVGGASGGVWKTTNFLTSDGTSKGSGSRHPVGVNAAFSDGSVRTLRGGGPRVIVFDGSTGAGSGALRNLSGQNTWQDAVQVSRLSLAGGVGGFEGSDPAAVVKAKAMIGAAARSGFGGGVFVAAGDLNGVASVETQGRLVVGSEAGIWRGGSSEAARRAKCTNNLKQIGLAIHSAQAVDILVTDPSGAGATVFSLHDVKFTRLSPDTVELKFASVE